MVRHSVRASRRAGQSAAVLSFLAWIQSLAAAQAPDACKLSAELRREVIDQVAQLLREQYVSPELGQACAERIRTRLAAGAYDDITDPAQFAGVLTADLRAVDDDAHLRVETGPPDRFQGEEPGDSEAERKRLHAAFRRDNFGFRTVEVLDDNVGYLDLRTFAPTAVGADAAIAALTLLSNCDVLIIDLRENGGGSASMVQLIASYFFAEPKHLISVETRGEPLVAQMWTQAYVPGRRLSRTPLFIITSRRTASAAEEFAYDLKHHGRATLIGETTAGAGHTAYIGRVADLFNVVVPHGRPIHPVTGTGWERAGVTPDIEVAASQALTRARLEAAKVAQRSADTGAVESSRNVP